MKKRLIIAASAVLAVFLILLVFSNILILRNFKFIVFPSDVPPSDIGLVFGAGLNSDGTMGRMLSDRVAAAVSLYREGKIRQIMVTGDDGQMKSDEVDAIHIALLDAGIPQSKIIVDRHGYRTYESCFREAKVYGITSLVAVSQAFHLPRIVYLCEHMGIKTIGVASDFRYYGWDGLFMNVREMGARLKAWWQVEITKPNPRLLTKD